MTKHLAKLPKVAGECGVVGAQLIRSKDGNATRCQTLFQLMNHDLGILQAVATELVLSAVEGCQTAMILVTASRAIQMQCRLVSPLMELKSSSS